ncbi:hypothetical protein ACWD7F_15935 [Streptomyces sp. NPDC005122]
MSRGASPESVGRGWDGPRFRVPTDTFQASFLPSPDEGLLSDAEDVHEGDVLIVDGVV